MTYLHSDWDRNNTIWVGYDHEGDKMVPTTGYDKDGMPIPRSDEQQHHFYARATQNHAVMKRFPSMQLRSKYAMDQWAARRQLGSQTQAPPRPQAQTQGGQTSFGGTQETSQVKHAKQGIEPEMEDNSYQTHPAREQPHEPFNSVGGRRHTMGDEEYDAMLAATGGVKPGHGKTRHSYARGDQEVDPSQRPFSAPPMQPNQNSKHPNYPSEEISSEKAKQILRDGEANGHPLTPKQKGMFGAAAGKSKNAKMPEDIRRMSDQPLTEYEGLLDQKPKSTSYDPREDDLFDSLGSYEGDRTPVRHEKDFEQYTDLGRGSSPYGQANSGKSVNDFFAEAAGGERAKGTKPPPQTTSKDYTYLGTGKPKHYEAEMGPEDFDAMEESLSRPDFVDRVAQATGRQGYTAPQPKATPASYPQKPMASAGYPRAGSGFTPKRNQYAKEKNAAGDYLLKAPPDEPPGAKKKPQRPSSVRVEIPKAGNQAPIPLSGPTQQPRQPAKKPIPVGRGVKPPPVINPKIRTDQGAYDRAGIKSSRIGDIVPVRRPDSAASFRRAQQLEQAHHRYEEEEAQRRRDMDRNRKPDIQPRRNAKVGLGDSREITGDRYPMGDGPAGGNIHYLDQEFEETGHLPDDDFKDVVKHSKKDEFNVNKPRRPPVGPHGENTYPDRPTEIRKYPHPKKLPATHDQGDPDKHARKVKNSRKPHILDVEDYDRLEALLA